MTRLCSKAGLIALAAALALCIAAPAFAAGSADLEARIAAMEKTLQSMRSELAATKAVQAEMTQAVAVKAAKDAMPSWLKRISFYGDLRARFQGAEYDDLAGKAKDGRNRFRIRLRFGVKSQIHKDWEVGFRMVSGADTDPTSTNQTLESYFQEHANFGWDRAYVTWTPSALNKILAWTYGKAANPLLTSQAIYDGDVVPEGSWIKLTFNRKGAVQPFFVLGSFFLVEHTSDGPPDDVYAYLAQAGVTGKAGALKYAVAAAYTDWGALGDAGNVAGDSTGEPGGTPTYTDGAGATRTTNYKVWDVIAKAKIKLDKMSSLGFWAHYLTNTDSKGVAEGEDTGYAGGITYAYKPFKIDLWYKHIEANATPGFIADSDSAYANREGYVAKVAWQAFKRGTFSVAYYKTDPIKADLTNAKNGERSVFVDFVFKF